MSSLAVQSLERLLDRHRFGATLGKPVDVGRLRSTGVTALDAVLGGGWRIGAMSELVGRRGVGRTAVVVQTLAEATRQGHVAALVDAVDRFDPTHAETMGVELASLLWVRGAPLHVERAQPPLIEHAVKQAVRACDLVLRAGGFSVVVLDLADISPRRVQALPSITWLRLAHATEGTDTACLLVGEAPIGRSARGASVLVEARPVWTGTSPQARRFMGLEPEFKVRQ